VATRFKIELVQRRIEKLFRWRARLLTHAVLSFVEAVLVLLMAYVYLIVLSLTYGLDTAGVDLVDSVKETVKARLRPTDMIIYVAGILSSTTGYFVVRLLVLETHVKQVAVILVLTVGLVWVATPLFLSGIQQPPANQPFAAGIAKVVGLGALCIWLWSLFCQRRIFEREVTLQGDRRGNEIAQNVGGFDG